MRRPTLAAAQFALLALPVTSVSASPRAPATLSDRCEALRTLSAEGLSIVSAGIIRTASPPSPGGTPRPPSCRVKGIARPTPRSEILFELWLPSRWNGRYVQLGNGGFAGNIDEPSLAAEIERGNAAAMTNTGHSAGQFDASWALGQPDRILDYGHRSIKVTSDAAHRLLREYYGRSSDRNFYVGCSNGGRQALMAAQHYPDDWDGILAGAPAVQWTKQFATFAAIEHRLLAAPANWLPAAKLPAIQRAALAGCPPSTVSHGVADDPRLCAFDARKLLCHGVETRDCLTAQQANTLDLIRSGPRAPNGGFHYFGFEPTSASGPGTWDRWIVPPRRDAPDLLTFATQAYRYLILDDPSWTVGKFEPRHLALASERRLAGQRLAEILDPDEGGLGRFNARGGKLVMYFGWGDPVISPRAGVDYYERVTLAMGGLKRTKGFFRLFMIPGMQHCQGGLAPSAFGQAWVAPGLYPDARHDVRRALESWVEQGRAPAAVRAVRYRGDPLRREAESSREIRPYPLSPGPVLSIK